MYIKTIFITPLILALTCLSLTAQSAIQLAEGGKIEADNSMDIYINNSGGTANEGFQIRQKTTPNSSTGLLNLSLNSENYINGDLRLYGGLSTRGNFTVRDSIFSEEGILLTPENFTFVLDDDNSGLFRPIFSIRDGSQIMFSMGGFGASQLNSSLDIDGDLNVTGSISKGGGTFRIDHPLDPENKYLYHSFIESPDMMNIYNGNAKTDGEGFVTIELPKYFEALNVDYRYQLTVLEAFAFAIVHEKIKENTFTIQTSEPNVEVSWQVTGIRNDAWAKENRVQVEVEKDLSNSSPSQR